LGAGPSAVRARCGGCAAPSPPGSWVSRSSHLGVAPLAPYTLDEWDEKKEEVAAELKRRGLKIVQGHTKTNLHILNPDGLECRWAA
jgi:hypothetical protein